MAAFSKLGFLQATSLCMGTWLGFACACSAPLCCMIERTNSDSLLALLLKVGFVKSWYLRPFW